MRARAEAPLVTTIVDDCVPIDRAQLDRLLSIELGTSADTAASSATGPTLVRVGCVPAGIELNLQDALTQKGMVRVLSRESFRDASSTRLLALAIAEFVVASWVELRLPQKVEPEPVMGTAPATAAAREVAANTAAERVQPAPRAREDETHTEIGLSGQLQVWSQIDAPMFGAGVRLVHAPVPGVAFSIGGDFGATDVDTALGRIIVRTFGFSLTGLGRVDLSPFVLVTGPGARFGLGQMSGTSDPMRAEVSPFYAPFAGVFWLARGALFVADGFAVTLELELGACTLPMRALIRQTTVAAALDGVWLTTGLGVAFEL